MRYFKILASFGHLFGSTVLLASGGLQVRLGFAAVYLCGLNAVICV